MAYLFSERTPNISPLKTRIFFLYSSVLFTVITPVPKTDTF